MSEKMVTCPQCWTENFYMDFQCQTCGRYLRTLEEQEALMEKATGIKFSKPLERRDASVPSKRKVKKLKRPDPNSIYSPRPAPKPGEKVKRAVKLPYDDEDDSNEEIRPLDSLKSLLHDEDAPKPVRRLNTVGLNVRFFSTLIDLAVALLFAFGFPLWMQKVSGYELIWPAHMGVGIAFFWLYVSLFQASGLQATPGQSLCGVIVVDQREQQLNILVSLYRNLIQVLMMASVVGVLWMVFSSKKFGWHDTLSKTQVMMPAWVIEQDGQWVSYESRKTKWFSLLRNDE